MKKKKRKKKSRFKNIDILPIGSMYIGLCNTRSTEARLRWISAQFVFLASVSGIVTVIYKLLTTSDTKIVLLLFVFSMVMSALQFFWYRILVRNGQYMDHWNTTLATLEKKHGKHIKVGAFSSRRYKQLANSQHRLQSKLELVFKVLVGAWVVVSVGVFVLLLVQLST